MSFNSREFRNCLGAFATGVTVVTAADAQNEPFAITINSFSSVSLEPPLILFCIDKSAFYYQSFLDAAYFGINILSEQQRKYSDAFAKSSAQPWDEVSYTLAKKGSPQFKDNHGFMECTMHATHDAGDHTIVVGKVLNLEHNEKGFPLLYYRGKYHTMGHPLKEDLS